jgi:hypothetical protein
MLSMTKDQAINLLSAAGNVVDVHDISETYARVDFKSRGTTLNVYTDDNDPDFLYLVCSYSLPDGVDDELAVARILSKAQSDLKVAKLTADFEHEYVAASAEQYIPQCDEFEGLFWRSVDLVMRAADRVMNEIHTLETTDKAAERFTRELEASLQPKGEANESHGSATSDI